MPRQKLAKAKTSNYIKLVSSHTKSFCAGYVRETSGVIAEICASDSPLDLAESSGVTAIFASQKGLFIAGCTWVKVLTLRALEES